MKRFSFLLLLSVLFTTSFAYDIKYDNVFYNLDHASKTATVTYEKEEYEGERDDYYGIVTIADSIKVDDEVYCVKSIGESAFAECYKLFNVIMSNTIENIESNAFSGCHRLNTLTISTSLINIGYRAFYNCDNLDNFIMPNKVTNIGAEAFCGCTYLHNLFISSSVTDIDYDAFYDCVSLKNVYISDLTYWCNINFVSIYSNPLYYAYQMLLKSKVVNNLVIPQTITEIKPYAFIGCNSITSLSLPNSVTSIGEMAFFGCPNLKVINIPASVEFIDYKAFKLSCIKGEINLYNTEMHVEEEAFESCTGTLHVVKDHKDQYSNDSKWEDFQIVDDMPSFCAEPVITFQDGQLHITSETPGATCHLLQTFGEVEQGKKLDNLPISAYATAEGYQQSKVITVWLKDIIK